MSPTKHQGYIDVCLEMLTCHAGGPGLESQLCAQCDLSAKARYETAKFKYLITSRPRKTSCIFLVPGFNLAQF